MAIKFIGIDANPSYLALASDINTSASLIIGAAIIGKLVYAYDSKKWYIITGSGTGSACQIYPYVEPKLET